MYLLAAAAGAANPVQAGANAELRKSTDHALFSAAVVYFSGLLGVLLIELVVRQTLPDQGRIAATRWWAWTGGLLSIGSTLAGITLAQRMGSGVFTGLSVTASLTLSILLDHFGLIGFKVHPASTPRMAGCALMIAGLWLVAKF